MESKAHQIQLTGVSWFEIERYPEVINPLLLLFDKIYVPNTLWIETGSLFENIFIKISHDKKEIYDVGLCPSDLGYIPEKYFISFSDVYGDLLFDRKGRDGIFVQYFDILKNINYYPTSFKTVLDRIFELVNKERVFREYNEFTYKYVDLIYQALFFIGRKETRGDSASTWFENFQNYVDECFNVEKNMPLVIDIDTIFSLEKYFRFPNIKLKHNPNILTSALLLSLARVYFHKFTTIEPKIILDLRESLQEERETFVNKIGEFSIKLHQMLNKDSTFEDLLSESEFIVKAEILPSYENFKIRYEKELNKSILKKFISLTDKIVNFAFSAFTLDYSESKSTLKDIYQIYKGDVLTKVLSSPEEHYSNFFYLLKIEEKI